jgi:hypothetical protein
LIGSAIHFVIHVGIEENTRRVMSIHEVVDSDGFSIVSNEIFSHQKSGNQFFSLRSGTSDLLSSYGFSSTRELSWV